MSVYTLLVDLGGR